MAYNFCRYVTVWHPILAKRPLNEEEQEQVLGILCRSLNRRITGVFVDDDDDPPSAWLIDQWAGKEDAPHGYCYLLVDQPLERHEAGIHIAEDDFILTIECHGGKSTPQLDDFGEPLEDE